MASRDSLKLRCSIAAILVAKNSECVMAIEIGTKVTKTEALHTSSKTPTTCHNTEFKRDAAISLKSHHHLPAHNHTYQYPIMPRGIAKWKTILEDTYDMMDDEPMYMKGAQNGGPEYAAWFDRWEKDMVSNRTAVM